MCAWLPSTLASSNISCKEMGVIWSLSYLSFIIYHLQPPSCLLFLLLVCGFMQQVYILGHIYKKWEELKKKIKLLKGCQFRQCNAFRMIWRSMHRFHPLDNRRTEAFGTSFENIPSKYTWKMGKNSRSSAWQDKEGLHETIQGCRSLVYRFHYHLNYVFVLISIPP